MAAARTILMQALMESVTDRKGSRNQQQQRQQTADRRFRPAANAGM
jgi:hypothetical protein